MNATRSLFKTNSYLNTPLLYVMFGHIKATLNRSILDFLVLFETHQFSTPNISKLKLSCCKVGKRAKIRNLYNQFPCSFNLYYNFQMPFRDAHSASGICVALAERKGVKIAELTLEDLKTIRYMVNKLTIWTSTGEFSTYHICTKASSWRILQSKTGLNVFYQLPLIIINCIAARCLINVVYSMCLYQVMMTLHFLKDVSNDPESTQKS